MNDDIWHNTARLHIPDVMCITKCGISERCTIFCVLPACTIVCYMIRSAIPMNIP